MQCKGNIADDAMQIWTSHAPLGGRAPQFKNHWSRTWDEQFTWRLNAYSHCR